MVCARSSVAAQAYSSVGIAIRWVTGFAAEDKELSTLSDLLRCIFPCPFRPIACDPGWLTPAVLSMTQTAYDERSLPAGTLDPCRFSVLADAVEEVGCTDADILSHLRSPGPHVRGCWPLDLILRKQ
jgi:hypothetical protein